MKRFFTIFLFIGCTLLALSPEIAYSNDLSRTDPEKRFLTPATLASNPDCEAAAESTKAAIGGVVGSLFTMYVGFPIYGAPIPGARVLATTLVVSGAAGLAASIYYAGMWFACAFAFVRHPVMRYEFATPDAAAGDYRQCKETHKPFPKECNQNFQTVDEYFVCIDKAFGGTGDVERGKNQEPRCRRGRYEKVNDYVWPRNRIPASRFIEICYRNPMGATEFFLTGGLSALGQIGEKLDNREMDFGTDSLHDYKIASNGTLECKVLQSTQDEEIFGVRYEARQSIDGKLCVRAGGLGIASWSVKSEIGCQLGTRGLPAPRCEASKAFKDMSGNITSYDDSECSSCFISGSCAGGAMAHSLAPIGITSVLVECFKESLHAMLTGCVNQENGAVETGFLQSAQLKLQNIVNAVLAIASMLMALKVLLGGVRNANSEIVMFIIKVSFIVYLTNGTAMSYYYDNLVKLSLGLSDIILSGAGNTTVCDYKPEDYATIHSSLGKDYSYLAPWDRLDCRMEFYLGGQLNGENAGTMLVLLLGGAVLIGAALLASPSLMINVVSLFATIMFILVICWMLYLFILSMIAMTILILLAPLFLPMMLFQVTKNFFDGWVKEIITYTIYPVMLLSFLSFMFSVYDMIYFNGLVFEREISSRGETSIKKIWYKVKSQDKNGMEWDQCSMEKHKNTLACVLSSYSLKSKFWILGLKFTDVEVAKDGDYAGIWTRLVVVFMLGFLFYHFLTTLGSLAAELAGNPRGDLSRGVKSPGQMMKSVFSAGVSVNKAAGKAIGKAGNAAKGAYNSSKGKGKGGDGEESVSSVAAGKRDGGSSE